MKKLLPMLLIVMALLWCLAGAVVLGPGILLYPAAWGLLALLMLGLHKSLHGSKDRTERQRESEPQREEVPHDSRMITS